MITTSNQRKNRYFRSLSDLNESPEFDQFLHREFPQAASEFPDGVSRRGWLKLMGASLALGGVAGCRYQKEEIAAFVVRPEGRVPGVPNYFATNFEWAGEVLNLLVTNMDGRPIKVDGNPMHPTYASCDPSGFGDGKEAKFASAGSSAIAQAAVLSLYDPNRLGEIIDRSAVDGSAGDSEGASEAEDEDRLPNWNVLAEYVASSKVQEEGGKGLAVVFEQTRSPSLARALALVKERLPEATLVRFAPFHDNTSAALAAAGATGDVVFDLTKAKVIVDLDCGLLCSHPNAVVHSRQFAVGRNLSGEMNRLYSVEGRYSTTGAAADFRLALRPSNMEAFLSKLEAAIDSGAPPQAHGDTEYSELEAAARVDRAIEVIATDLVAAKGASLVAIGAHHAEKLQAAVMRINGKLENFGKSVQVVSSVDPLQNIDLVEMSDFVDQAGQYSEVWVVASNPVSAAASDLDVATAMGKISRKVYLGYYDDETAEICDLVLPISHPLEAWGDVCGFDGSYGVSQPQIEPVLGCRDPIALLGELSGAYSVSTEQFVQDTAAMVMGKSLSEGEWKRVLHDGFAAGVSAKPVDFSPSQEVELVDGPIDPLAIDGTNVDIVLMPSEALYDGRLANNAWLQEMPQSITKLTWDNAAMVSPATADALGLKQNELAGVTVGGKSVSMPVFIVPGCAENCMTISLGYGRKRAGDVGSGVGHDVSALHTLAGGMIITGAEVRGTTAPYKLATTQDHFAIDEFGLEMVADRSPKFIREGTLETYEEHPDFAGQLVEIHHEAKSLWEEPIERIRKDPEADHLPQWGMTIDLNKCTGCNACVIACQAENNVPVVGKDQVARSREMHWLRIDRYFKVDFDKSKEEGTFKNFPDVSIVNQPLACVHCETAPCEQVCPVAATVHTEEGINAMAYNRCIGTRYCANNCPYKVRRFNYYNYNKDYGYYYGWMDYRESDDMSAARQKLQSLVLNPEVTVRGRGVMEKCTYCVQRTQNGKIMAKAEGRPLEDGDVKTACQEACASQAIVFGDISDKESRVAKLQRDPRAYAMLEELNVKPRTLYLARVRNVPERLATKDLLHPELHAGHGHGDHGEHGDGDHGEHGDGAHASHDEGDHEEHQETHSGDH